MRQVKMIQRVALYEGLSEAQLDALAGIAGFRDYAAGQVLFQAGEEAKGFYAVASGRVKVYRASPEGKEHILQIFGPGETVAEAAVLQGRTYPAGAQMLEAGELIYFPRDRFRSLLRDDPDLSLSLLGLLAERLRGFVRKIEALSLKEVPSRLAAHLLLLQSSQHSETLRLDLPKGQLALLLGTIPETLSRVLGRLAQEGVLEVRGSQVTVLDRERLEEIAQGD